MERIEHFRAEYDAFYGGSSYDHRNWKSFKDQMALERMADQFLTHAPTVQYFWPPWRNPSGIGLTLEYPKDLAQ